MGSPHRKWGNLMEAAWAVRLKEKTVEIFLDGHCRHMMTSPPYVNKTPLFIQTGLSQIIASIQQRKSGNGPPRRR